MELGIYSFAEVTQDPFTGETVTHEQRLKDLLEEIELADQVGLDVFGVGEHHRPDFIASNPGMVLAAAAARTKHIRLTSAVTVLSSEDPVRVFEQFATLDLISGGRAEIMAGRGSFIESFPLFGYDLADYDELFAEKLDLLLALRDHERVTWSGQHRPALHDQAIYPRPVQNPLPVWIAIGGTPSSALRAGQLGIPMAVAIIGGQATSFVPLVNYYRAVAAHVGHAPSVAKVGINVHGFIADTFEEAFDIAYPYHAISMAKIAAERGFTPPSRDRFRGETTLEGSQMVGTPEQVAEKILFQHEIFQHDRFLLQLSVGTIPHEKVMHAIELFGTKVAPIVRAELARRTEAAAPSVG